MGITRRFSRLKINKYLAELKNPPASWPNTFDYDIYENFEDVSLESGLTLVDTTSHITIPSNTQYYIGSNSMALDLNELAAEAHVRYAVTINTVSFGFWYRSGSYANWGGGPMIVNIRNDGYGNLVRMEDRRNAGDNTREISSEDGVVTISDYTWYWITIQYNRNATSYWRVYNTSGILVGSQQSFTAVDYEINEILLGSWSGAHACIIYFDGLVIDTTDATFPLLGWDT